MRRERLGLLVRFIAVATFSVGAVALLWLGFASQSATPADAATVFIEVGDFWFCNSSFQSGDCEIEIAVGDSVTWGFDTASAIHTSTECTGLCGAVMGTPRSRLWHSGILASGTFERTFDTPGVFQYQCNIHPGIMRGTITVSGAAPTLPMPPSPIPSETATPVPTLPVSPSPVPSETEMPVPTSTAVAPPTSAPPGLLGDVNGDGLVNSIDSALILQFSAGLLPTLSGFDRSDVNRDGAVNAVDSALILQFAAGLLTTL